MKTRPQLLHSKHDQKGYISSVCKSSDISLLYQVAHSFKSTLWKSFAILFSPRRFRRTSFCVLSKRIFYLEKDNKLSERDLSACSDFEWSIRLEKQKISTLESCWVGVERKKCQVWQKLWRGFLFIQTHLLSHCKLWSFFAKFKIPSHLKRQIPDASE